MGGGGLVSFGCEVISVMLGWRVEPEADGGVGQDHSL